MDIEALFLALTQSSFSPLSDIMTIIADIMTIIAAIIVLQFQLSNLSFKLVYQ